MIICIRRTKSPDLIHFEVELDGRDNKHIRIYCAASNIDAFNSRLNIRWEPNCAIDLEP